MIARLMISKITLSHRSLNFIEFDEGVTLLLVKREGEVTLEN